MGILNTTPDSFSDGGQFTTVQQAVDAAGQMLEEGAAIIDIGGESTRPGSDPVSEQEELDRVMPVIEESVKNFTGALFSIDTTKYRVAEEALKSGVHIVNDVSGLRKEPAFAELCAEYKAGYICMHSQGDPKTMQENPQYEDVIDEIKRFLKVRLVRLKQAGVESVIIDPGFGFGKTLEHNLEIVRRMDEFSELETPVLAGASRKSMIGMILDGRPSDKRLSGTLAVHYHCLMNGASILRVHDVREAVDTIQIFNAISGS
ncbi:MAG: dihydropteroate synthase [Bacteroidetes bacterium]|jgi:dihydropteroate synthase|nr:dihydropteroate synthase [Bacteroidota bacterium]